MLNNILFYLGFNAFEIADVIFSTYILICQGGFFNWLILYSCLSLNEEYL